MLINNFFVKYHPLSFSAMNKKNKKIKILLHHADPNMYPNTVASKMALKIQSCRGHNFMINQMALGLEAYVHGQRLGKTFIIT